LLIGGLWRQIQKVDAAATIPQVEIQLLRAISIFAALPAPSLEGVARDLEPFEVSQGTVVIKEGERGDCYYAIADGELAVTLDNQFLRTVSRGDGFGEIALIRDVPRSATVTAATDASLYTLDRERFIQAITGHATTISTVERVISKHLRDDVAE
jgi:CRP-like cAMP-binding protein